MRKRSATAALAALAVVGFAGQAQAAERLQAYKVKLGNQQQLEKLALAGYDITEGQRGRTIEIVATPRQAARLRERGIRARLARTPRGATVLRAHTAQADVGWKVWRPYARTDVAVSGSAGNPTDNILTQLQKLEQAHPKLVELSTLGHTHRGVPIVAARVTKNPRQHRHGSRPAVLYSSVQHAREWLAGETGRRTLRLFVDNYGREGTAVGTDGEPVAGVSAEELTNLVNTRELWFVLVANPDGYDHTFTPANRLWRKNLRDNNGDGQITTVDGVDPNRNFPTHWGYDDEGSSNVPNSETYRGPAPGSEPETQALDGLMQRVQFAWNKNDHTHGRLLLYPFGWQVDTHAADEPIFKAITGVDDDHPAIPTFDPDLGAELYTTNGDTNDHAYGEHGTISFTPEGTPGTGTGSGFIFQDVEADVQAEFERHVQFALDLARSAKDPSRPRSHLGNEVPDFEVDAFSVSYGSPQTVQVNARRDLGPIELKYRINDGPVVTRSTTEWEGGERYGDEGDYWYHRMRGQVTGAQPGDDVTVWFRASKKGVSSASFTYRQRSDSNAPVLILAAEDYSGGMNLPAYASTDGPAFLDFYEDALEANGVDHDVWDVDAEGRRAPDPLGVLSHYRAVVWYTGNDVFTQEQGIGGTQPFRKVSRIAHTTQTAVRDFLNEGGQVLYTGKHAGWQYTTSSYPEPGQTTAGCDANAGDTTDRCLPLSNDFFQYYLGAFGRIAGGGLAPGSGVRPFAGIDDPLGGLTATLNGPSSAGNQEQRPGPATTGNPWSNSTSAFLLTSSVLPADRFPQFASRTAGDWVVPGSAWAPHGGERYASSSQSNLTYKRLMRTIDLTGETGGALRFWSSIDTEATWDYVFVEAHEVGKDDWTTLPDRNGRTSQATGSSCTGNFSGSTWHQLHPQLARYQTINLGPPRTCTPTGTTGVWHARSGNSGGWQEWDVDLSAWAGKQVEVSISYVTDVATNGTLNVLVDDVTVVRGDEAPEQEGFESGLGAWRVPGAPAGSVANANDWTVERRIVGAATASDFGVHLGFGLEGVDTAQGRADLMARFLAQALG